MLDAARGTIAREVERCYGHQLTRSEADLFDLQSLIDDVVFDKGDEQAFLRIGVALGDAIESATGFKWASVEFDGERTPTLVLPGSGLKMFVVQMVWKRVSGAEDVNLAAIFNWAKELEREKRDGR